MLQRFLALTAVLVAALFLVEPVWAQKPDQPKTKSSKSKGKSSKTKGKVTEEEKKPVNLEEHVKDVTPDTLDALLTLRYHRGEPDKEDTRVSHLEEIVRLWPGVREDTARYHKLLTEHRTETIAAKALAKTLNQRKLLDRHIAWLEALGEPCGADMVLRAAPARNDLISVLQAYRITPKGAAYLSSELPKLEKLAAAEGKAALPKIEKAIQDGEWSTAEELIFASLDKLHLAGWNLYEFAAFHPVLKTLVKHHDAVVPKTNLARRETGAAVVQRVRDAHAPAFDKILTDGKAAAAQLASSAQADYGGEKLSGPDLLKRLCADWKTAQQDAWYSLDLFFAQRSMNQDAKDSLEIIDRQNSFTEAMTALLGSVVSAEATRASAEEAATLYPKHVQNLAELLALTDMAMRDRMTSALGGPLDQLAKKGPQLEVAVAQYRRATDDLLRWRRRTAELLSAKARTEVVASKETGVPGLLLDGIQYSIGGKFDRSAPDIATDLQRLLLPYVSVDSFVLGPRGENQPSLSGPVGFFYSRLQTAGDNITRPLVDSLRKDLFATPLSLDAALSLESAVRGDFVVICGARFDFQVSGVVPRMSRIGKEEWGLVRIAPMPRQIKVDAAKQVLIRIDLQPVFVQHSHGFIRLAPTPTATPPANAAAANP